MRLLHIPNYYYPHTGGIEQVCRDVVHSLSNRNIEQKIICFNWHAERSDLHCKTTETTVDTVDDVEIHRCGCIAKIASQSISLTYPSELRKLINDFDPETIIFHYPNPFVAAFLIPLIKKDVKLVLYWHLDITKQKFLKYLFYGQTYRLLERANVVVSTSPNYIEGSTFLSRYKNKCKVIPNCVSISFDNISDSDIKKANEIRKKYKDKFISFTIGRHIPYKGLKYLIESAKYLNDDYIVLIGGNGPLTKSLKEKSSELKNVCFLGFVNEENLISYYLACDVISFSSITKNEGFGISLAEGMSFGKPAVTFTIPGSGVNYVNLNQITGIEVPNKDCKAYAEAIKKLHDDKELYKEYSENARERVLQNFTFEIFRESIVKIIEDY